MHPNHHHCGRVVSPQLFVGLPDGGEHHLDRGAPAHARVEAAPERELVQVADAPERRLLVLRPPPPFPAWLAGAVSAGGPPPCGGGDLALTSPAGTPAASPCCRASNFSSARSSMFGPLWLQAWCPKSASEAKRPPASKLTPLTQRAGLSRMMCTS